MRYLLKLTSTEVNDWYSPGATRYISPDLHTSVENIADAAILHKCGLDLWLLNGYSFGGFWTMTIVPVGV
jgi:hypothetical protein